MSGLKKWLNALFAFSRTESNAFIILLPVVVIIVFSEPVTRWYLSHQPDDFSAENARLDSLTASWSTTKASVANAVVSEKKYSTPFPFDPNKISIEDLRRIGFSSAQAKRLSNYRLHGGTFKIKSDLGKIYGIDSALYRKLYPYILLPSKLTASPTERRDHDKAPSKNNIARFDINKADTTLLKNIYGIGSTLANRIIKYRNRLGGFVVLSQLNEVYGLDTTVITRLLNASYLAQDFEPVRIDVNKATQHDLESHPYLSRAAAKAIVTYRYQHGQLKTEEELVLLPQIKNKDKLIPYLKFD